MKNVGIVIVSHSPLVAEGAADMVRQMLGDDVPLAWCGGNPDGGLGTSVEALRGRVTELTDWRRQVREHKQQLILGAAAVGFVVGVRLMMRRRRS